MEHTPVLPSAAFTESAGRILPTNAGIEPLAAVARALRGFNRDQLGSAIEVLIALLDVAEGDPEAEDATDAENDFAMSPLAEHFTSGPGCVIADEPDAAYVEWHTKPGNTRRKGQPEYTLGQEDDELAGDETDGNFAEDEPCAEFALRGSGPECRVSDESKGGFND